LTVAELFAAVKLSPRGPITWGTDISESDAGVYLVARVPDANTESTSCPLPLIDPLPLGVGFDLEYELQRWLPNESIVYIGKADRPIRDRLREFRRHRCDDKSPHAGGQVIKLLHCALWVYWSPALNPYELEQMMIGYFKNRTGQEPYANAGGKRNIRRIRQFN